MELKQDEVQSILKNNNNVVNVFEEYKSKLSYIFKTDQDRYYNIILESVLTGHEEAVSSVQWANFDNKIILISSSFDFTVGIWEFCPKEVYKHELLTLESLE